jgi:hypothetical protein
MILRGKYVPVLVVSEHTRPAKTSIGLGLVRSAFGAAIVTGIFALAAAAQSNSGHCVPGITQECACGDHSGSQTCGTDGQSFSTCACSGSATTTSSANSTPPASDLSILTAVASTPAAGPSVEASKGSALALYASFDRPHVKAVGEFKTECALEQGILSMRVRTTPRVSSDSYGGCCVEARRDVDLGGNVEVNVAAWSSQPEPEFHAKLEAFDYRIPDFIYQGPLTSGRQRFSGLAEQTPRAVRRACFVVMGRGLPAHTTAVRVEAPSYVRPANPQRKR